MRIVFVTQTIDADHPALAQTIDKVRALADRFAHVAVLCDRVGRHDLPDNVVLRTFGSRTRWGRGLRFERELAAELLPGHAPDALLAHMIPEFLVLAAPLAKARRVPLLLWYTHWNASRMLRFATRLADAVLSVDTRSFPLDSPKVRGVGHAIDVERFAPARGPHIEGGPLQLLALGRMAPWKGYATLLEGLRLAADRGLDARLEVRGPDLTEDERRHRRELERTVRETPALRDRVELAPAAARDRLPALLGKVDALVSATQPRGSETLDKVVFEAAACGVPVLASNTALDEFLGALGVDLRFRARDPEDLSAKLLAFAAVEPQRRHEIGLELRRRVVASHSVSSWADGVVATVSSLARE